ncbi:MAG: dicarboxylate/amino acid:cation symporter, partial [Neisseriaceae bacterium]|nr:dicarboxylate/amino acid:cation symporter [Neisseriaceae bacterium]
MKKMGLSTKVFLGFVVGIALGLIFKQDILVIKPVGDLFLTLIKMLVVPLVFFSIVSGVASISDVQKLKRIGSKTMLYYVVTTMLAGCIGLAVAHIVQPGSNFDLASLQTAAAVEAKAMPTLGETLLSIFPSNPVKALVDGNLMQIIVFALFFGISITLIGEKAAKMNDLMKEGTEIMYKMTAIVMAFSPIGVAALIACTIGEYGFKIFGPLAKFILTDYLGLIAVIVLMYLVMLKFIAKVPLRHFFKHITSI